MRFAPAGAAKHVTEFAFFRILVWPMLAWLCRFSGPSHFTKTCGHWQVVGVSTRVLTRSPAALCTVGGSFRLGASVHRLLLLVVGARLFLHAWRFQGSCGRGSRCVPL